MDDCFEIGFPEGTRARAVRVDADDAEVVIDGFTQSMQPRDDNGSSPVSERCRDGSDPGVRDDHARRRDEGVEGLERQIVDATRPVGPELRGAVLHDDRLIAAATKRSNGASFVPTVTNTPEPGPTGAAVCCESRTLPA